METLKQAALTLKNKLKDAIEGGNVNAANEITANLMVGFMASLMAGFMLLGWILNECGVFSADAKLMRLTAIITICISLAVSLVNRFMHGDGKWVKYVMMVGLVFVCGAMSGTLGHNVTLVTVIPVILSIRYCDRKFSVITALFSAFCYFWSTLTCAFYGIENLNILPLESGTVLTVTGSLREAIGDNFDRFGYAMSYLQNDYFPKAIIFAVISLACIMIAGRGRNFIDFQTQSAQKTARIETELTLANEIQANMLPCIFPAFPEHAHLDLFARNIPAKEVGGDFYDYFRIDDDHVAFLIADVSGKGVGAALFMMIAKTILRDKLLLGLPPAAAMTQTNRELCENNVAGLFVTVWVGVYEVSTGKLTYVNAGHNPPIVKKSGTECYFHKSARGLVLAGLDCTVYRQQEMTLKAGDEIFLYTDGVTEATDVNDCLFGEQRLLDRISEAEGESVEEQVEIILKEINRFCEGAEQFDDITMLGMKVK